MTRMGEIKEGAGFIIALLLFTACGFVIMGWQWLTRPFRSKKQVMHDGCMAIIEENGAFD